MSGRCRGSAKDRTGRRTRDKAKGSNIGYKMVYGGNTIGRKKEWSGYLTPE